jgi:hypothetical protein
VPLFVWAEFCGGDFYGGTSEDEGSPEAAEDRESPSREEIEQLARKFWAERGYQDGYAEQDWLRAEQELLGMAS